MAEINYTLKGHAGYICEVVSAGGHSMRINRQELDETGWCSGCLERHEYRWVQRRSLTPDAHDLFRSANGR